jgi:glycerol kinase
MSAWKLDRAFLPDMADSERDRRYGRWLKAIDATIGFSG